MQETMETTMKEMVTQMIESKALKKVNKLQSRSRSQEAEAKKTKNGGKSTPCYYLQSAPCS